MLTEPEFRNRKAGAREPVRILLVEDDPQFAELLRMQLRRLPTLEARLDVVGTLAQALERLADERFGLILTDLNLPDSSGLATVEALSRDGEQLVIVLTGYEAPQLRAGALEAGAFDFLSKDQLSAASLDRIVRLAAMQSNTYGSLRDSESRLRSLLELSSDVYWEQDEEFRFTSFTERRSAKPDGLGTRALIGRRRWENHYINLTPAQWKAHIALLEAHQPFHDLELCRLQDGRELWISTSGEPVFDAAWAFRGYRGVATDITARKRAEDELRRFRMAMDASGDMILLIDRATMRNVDVNSTACRLLGYSREELLSMGPADLLPVSREELERTYDRLIANPAQASGMKSYYRCKDGSQLPFESTRRVLRSGDSWLIAAVSRDIRERISAEKALRESEARKSAILDATMDAVVTMDHLGCVVEFNPAAEKCFGYPRSEAIGKEMAELIIPPEMRVAHRDGISRYLATGAGPMLGSRIEVAAMRADGSRFDAELAIVRIPHSDPPLFTGTARDISERKSAELRRKGVEEKLRESEARFRSLTELTSDWYWEQDESFRFTAMSGGNIDGRLGLPLREHLGKTRWELPALNLTEEDWAKHRAQLERREPFHDFEIQRRDANGHVRWASISGEPIIATDGQFRGYRGVGKDITERKRAEEEQRASSQLLDNIVENVPAAIQVKAVRDDSYPIVMWNKAAEAMYGVPREEAIGRTVHDLWPQSSAEAFHAADAALVARGGMDDFPDRLAQTRHRGEIRVHMRKVPLYDPSGKPTHLLVVADDITDKLADEARLRESEERFRSLAELSSDFYWETDAQHRIVLTGHNSRHQPVIGARQAGLTRWETPSTQPDAAGWAAHRETMEAHLPFRDFEFARLDKDGVERHLSVSGEPVFDAGGTFLGYRGVGRDITARKREEQLLRLEHLVARSLSETEDAAAGVRAVLRAVCETEGWACGRYFRWDEADNVLRFQDAWWTPDAAIERFVDQSRKLTFAPGSGIAGRVWQGREPLWSTDVERDARTQSPQLSADSGVRGVFAFPANSERGCLGILSFASWTVREPDERLLRSARVIGGQIGQFLMRKRVESELASSEARFRQTFELAGSGIAHVDLEGRFMRVNSKLCEILGYAESELLGHSVKAISHPEDRDVTDEARARMHAGRDESVQFEKRYIRKDGSVVWVNLTVSVQRGADGLPEYEISIMDDISGRKAAESALHRFRTALDSSADMVFLVNARSARLVDFNDTACSYLGYKRAELLGCPSERIVDGTSADALIASYGSLLAEPGRADSLVRTYRRKDGSTFVAEVLRRIIESPDGPILVINARDLTERKAVEARQAAHLRYQERIARFGQSALAKREPADLVAKAVQSVLEALVADAVAYLEPAADAGEMTVRELAGELQPDSPASCRLADPFLQVLRTANRSIVAGADLPLSWAQGMGSVALVPVRGESAVRGILCACYRRAEAFAADELNFVDAAASVLSAGLQRIDSEARLAYLAQFDALTGLPNRALLADRFSQMIVQANRHERSLGVLFVDLDEFKIVNDTLGHAGGDALLKEVSVRLQAAVRPGDTVARISGDEFAVVLADLAQPEDAALVAQKVLDRLAAPVDVLGSEAFVTASVGISVYPGDGNDAEALLGAADAAMYRAKQSGRNAYQFFTAEITQRTRARAQLAAELRRALEREEFALVYQPKVSLETRRPHGAEALLRWRHPERGMVSPAEFIPVLEETGLIVQVGEWVLRAVCADLKAWRAAGSDPGPVAINLSARQFRQSDLDARITGLIKESGVDPAAIELEITESQLMHDPEHAIRMMQSLRQAGMRIAIDDFGTGYSSLSSLTRFPVVSLKIDRSFVADVYNDPGDAAIVRTIIEMAHTLGFTVVAEGVETEEQAKFLRLLRCEEAQGYLFARPMPAAELSALISSFASGRAGN